MNLDLVFHTVLTSLAVVLAIFALRRKVAAEPDPRVAALCRHLDEIDQRVSGRLVRVEERLSAADHAAATSSDNALAVRLLRAEERLAVLDAAQAGLRDGIDSAKSAAVGPLGDRLDVVEADVVRLTSLIRYELVQQLAQDAVHYAEQRATEKSTAADKRDSALDYARIQAAKIEAKVDADALRLAIEAKVGEMNS